MERWAILVIIIAAATKVISASAPEPDIYDVTTTSGIDNVTAEEEPAATINPIMMFFYRASQMRDFKIGYAIEVYTTPVLCVIGLVGNALSALVMFSNLHVSCYLYMGVLAITDSVALLIYAGFWIMRDALHSEFSPWTHRLICAITQPIGAGCVMAGTYLILAMTVDRYVAVRYPLKALHWCNLRKAKFTSAAIVAACLAFKSPYLHVSRPVFPGGSCSAFQLEMTTPLVVYYWINSSLGVYVPFFALLVLNCYIIRAIRRRGAYFRKQHGGADDSSMGGTQDTALPSVAAGDSDDITMKSIATTVTGEAVEKSGKDERAARLARKKARADNSLTAMLLVVTFSFLCLSAPIYIFYVVYIIKSNMASSAAYAEFVLAGFTCNKMLHTNYSINFYLYCLGGSKFRSDLKKVLIKLCCRNE